MKKTLSILYSLILLLSLAGCSTTYYSFWETMGKHKRDLLKENVKKASDEQTEASEQFKDALTRLKEIYAFDGGDLEAAYNKLKEEYDACKKKADAVTDRIDKVEDIADDLFSEWKGELKQISSKDLRKTSEKKLKSTRERFEVLHDTMRKAEKRMEPVLSQLNDQVLYLKHNLNAQAIGSLKGEMQSIEIEVETLIKDMQRSIAEADAFIKEME